MSKALELLKITEEEVPATSAPAGEIPSEAKPNTNFSNTPGADKAIHKIASELSLEIENLLSEKITDAIAKDPVFSELIQHDEDAEMMAHHEIKMMISKMLAGG
jgi:hypothetical protein